MHSIAAAVAHSGLLSKEALAEFKRWGFVIDAPEIILEKPEDVVQVLEEALQDEGLVLIRETDFEAVESYIRGQTVGTLHVVVEGADEDLSSDIECSFGLLATGEYIIRWYSESIEDVMTNGKTYLEVKGEKVFFVRCRELFFGDTKSFIVCTPEKTNG
jgi:hypothetical protein